jgi:hypothetical protein
LLGTLRGDCLVDRPTTASTKRVTNNHRSAVPVHRTILLAALLLTVPQ